MWHIGKKLHICILFYLLTINSKKANLKIYFNKSCAWMTEIINYIETFKHI